MVSTRTGGFAILLCMFGPSMPLPAEPAGDTAAITLGGGRVMRPSGQLESNLWVVVRDGKIKRVGAQPGAPGQAVHRMPPKAVLCPGLIDVFSQAGAIGQTEGAVSAVDPDAAAADALNPLRPEFEAYLRAGVTTAMVAPVPKNLVSGQCVSFRTLARDARLDVLRADGPLVFGFGEGVWRRDRAPTSRAGAYRELLDLLREGRAGDAPSRINAALAGELDGLFVCPEAQDVLSVRRALGDEAGHFLLVHSNDAIDVSEDVAAFRQPMVLGPYSFDSPRRVLLGAAAVSDAGIEIALRGGSPELSPASLRITAALAVRHGLDPSVARRAITVTAAKVAGVEDRVGAIAVGREADLVVFSDDPLRLDARVLEVYVQGTRVYDASLEGAEL